MKNNNLKMEIKRKTNGEIDKVFVCKAFYENANIYGTKEYELWNDFISKNGYAPLVVNKRKKTEKMKDVSRKNMTYKNMILFIETQENSEVYLKTFNTVKQRSKIQKDPYEYVADWFTKTFPDYNNHKAFKDIDETESPDNVTELNVSNF